MKVRRSLHVTIDKNELALWHEVGERGDAFRRATRGRAAEQTRASGGVVKIFDPEGAILEAVTSPGDVAPDPDDETTPRLP